ncbi:MULTISPECIES: hypothetical protein [Enterococcus]|uniref:Uncharacterized protein n=2 Tax=Enterococcus malodoratus TaxID=71451 RepID=R2RJ19_9ENTE|nr:MULTISPECIES: hypothetical protein [Enterococcus]EOH75994.1 hypothetical protein UAI_02624 [Enterococcus malodoratus ATCC 43197]EOT67442.1 hypothetical protein I585_02963 [Enterococcus malodoratus ATCC 43197]SPX03536.1 Uncharacterised protein [Enterococcus malodoratus]STD69306.1 Uncharacterised protein [Enterococcus malodoratus]HCM86998.1 hypothetical protein [Enterococcus sp.]
MEIKQLTRRQLFTMRRENLEKKVITYYNETRDIDSVIEYGVAIMIRHALVLGDFRFLFQDVVREIFLYAEPSETMRRFCPYYKNYFEASEWNVVTKRLFTSEKKYLKATKKARLFESHLRNRGNLVVKEKYESHSLVSIFEDTNGKRHTWRLRDADPSNTIEETKRILEILTTLTIFHKNNVRQFAKFVNYDCSGSSLISSSRQLKKQSQEESAQNTASELTATTDSSVDQDTFLEGFDLSVLSKRELIVIIKEIVKEAAAEEAELGEEILKPSEEFMSNDWSAGRETSLASRIVPEKKSDTPVESVQNKPADLVAVGAAASASEAIPPEKSKGQNIKKRPSKRERKLLEDYKQRRK